jgi:hypothetical protein
MKKKYIQPSTKEVMLMQKTQLMAGSGGPGAGEQHNPGMGGGSRLYRDFEDDEEDDEEF